LAVAALKERKGSSVVAIKRSIGAKHTGLAAGWEKRVNAAVKLLAAKGSLAQHKGHFTFQPWCECSGVACYSRGTWGQQRRASLRTDKKSSAACWPASIDCHARTHIAVLSRVRHVSVRTQAQHFD
jgi:hypothetical protein